jgi:hypothetical protein
VLSSPFPDNKKDVTDSTNMNIVVSLFGFLSVSMSKPLPRIDADVVCLQEVPPVSFEEDFSFMEDLGTAKSTVQ